MRVSGRVAGVEGPHAGRAPRRPGPALGVSLGLVLAGLGGLATPASAKDFTLSVPQARALAREAYLSGRFELAYSLAKGFLQRDPKDVSALMLLAATAPRLGHAAEGRRAGRAAFRLAGTPAQRYQAARLTALAAVKGGRPTLGQFWLRRSADAAPTAAERARSVADLRLVRAHNPWRLVLGVSAAPSSNLNGGASGGTLVVEGVPWVGVLSGDAQALSGWRETASAKLTYALPPKQGRQLVLGAQLFATFNQLSDKARALAPTARGSDFNYSLAELSATQTIVPAGTRIPLSFGAALGRSWYGERGYEHHLRLSTGARRALGKRVVAGTRLSVERQWFDRGGQLTSWVLGGDASYRLGRGAHVFGVLMLQDTRSGFTNLTYRGISAEIGYGRVRLQAPVSVAVSLNAGLRDYPVYSLGLFTTPGGRRDRRLGVALELTFNRAAVLGYAPTLRLSGTKVWSNVSRFDTDELALSLGLRSTF